MKKLNSKGFGAAEAILIVVILGLIGGVGYYIYNQNQNDISYNNDTPAAQTTTQEKTKTENEVPEGWRKYSNKDLGVAFIYPADWKLSDTGANPNEHGFDVEIASPDSKREDSGGIDILKAGAYFYVSVGPNENGVETPEEFVAYYKDPDHASFEENVELKTVGKYKAAVYDCGHNNPFYCVTFVQKGKTITVEYEYPGVSGNFRANKQKSLATFNQLLDSLELL